MSDKENSEKENFISDAFEDYKYYMDNMTDSSIRESINEMTHATVGKLCYYVGCLVKGTGSNITMPFRVVHREGNNVKIEPPLH